MTTPTIDEPVAWMTGDGFPIGLDEAGDRKGGYPLYSRPAPPADVAAAVDACFRECLLSSQAGFKNDVRTAFAALRAKLGVGS